MRTTPINRAMLATLMLAAAGCGAPQEKPAETATAVAPAPVPVAPATPAFQPFDVMEIEHTVKDYAVWKKGFDTDSTARTASGLAFLAMGKNTDNANDLLIVMRAADVAKAKAFAADPRLKNVMEKYGVTSKPELNYWHVIRHTPDPNMKTWVTITHRVKDFDAWQKVFDNEGTAARAAEGLADDALARGIDDPNVVHIVFGVKDLAQAKASIGSDKKKALMMSAGVEGQPTIKFYTAAE